MSGLKNASPISMMLICLVTALGLLAGLGMSDYWMYVIAIGLAQSVFGLSIGVVFGQAGMLSVAQVSIGAIGAWSVAALAGTDGPLHWAVALVIGAILSMAFGLLVALPALRLRQINLAVVTLGVVLAIFTVARAGHVPGASLNYYVAPPEWGSGYLGLYLLCWLSFGGLALLTVWLRRSRMGLSWAAISRSERAAAAIGVSVVRAKLTAFAVASGLAGWAGGLLVLAFGSADPANFEPVQVLTLFVLAVMMGAGLWEGALALGLFNAVSAALLRNWGLSPDIGAILFAIGAVQILAMESGGFSYDLRRVLRWMGRRFGRVKAHQMPRPLLRSAAAAPPPPVSAPPVLTLEEVTLCYGRVTALDAVSLQLAPGRILGVVGPNGAGKSSLIDTITGFSTLSSGKVLLDGQPLNGMPAHRRAALLRRTFQTERSIAEITPRDFLRLAALPGAPAAEIDALLAFIGCPPDAADVAGLDVRLRRLLGIAACLAAHPKVVLIDEPAAGLSAEESEDLAALLRQIPARFGCAVLLIEHDMDLVRATCDDLLALDFGKVIAFGPVAQVLADPRVMAAYLGEESNPEEEEGMEWAAS